MADATGDLIGTSFNSQEDFFGSVFEIAKTSGGYANAPATLVSFNGADGQWPYASPIADAAGDLLGTTGYGGADNDGTVFEIANNYGSYASTPTTLITFNGTDGLAPSGSLIADAAGDLFGTTYSGGADGDGAVFEIAKTAGGYASTPTILVSFNGTDGSDPDARLIADAAGNLFGTTFFGGVRRDNQRECRIASSSNAPERAKHCLIRMLPSRCHFVNRRPVGLGLRSHRFQVRGRALGMQENDPVPTGHRAASPGAVIGVPACTASLIYRVITGP